MRRIATVFAGLGALLALSHNILNAQSATAQLQVSANVTKNCTITTAPVAFGNYDSVTANNTAPLDGIGTITVTCTKGAVAKVGLNTGGNAQGTNRRMAGATAEYLTYELYKDTGRAAIWGNDASTGLDVPAADNQLPRNFTVYGRVPQAQVAAVGTYTDTVVATVNF